jgi:hypothetical protein
MHIWNAANVKPIANSIKIQVFVNAQVDIMTMMTMFVRSVRVLVPHVIMGGIVHPALRMISGFCPKEPVCACRNMKSRKEQRFVRKKLTF